MPEPDPTTQKPETTPDAGANSGTLTQEQVNQIVADRAKRAEEAAVKKLFDSLGVQSADEIKTVLEAKKASDEANKTELEKAASKATTAEAKLKQQEAEHATALGQMLKRILDSEIKQLAGRAVTDKEGKVTRAAFRTEALDDILLLVDRTTIEDKDGNYVGIDKALESLAKTKPYLLSEGGKPAQAQKGTPQPGERKPAQQQQQAPAPTFTL